MRSSILDFKSVIVALEEKGYTVKRLTKTASASYYVKICEFLKSGNTQEKTAESFNIDDRTVRWIKKNVCDCE